MKSFSVNLLSFLFLTKIFNNLFDQLLFIEKLGGIIAKALMEFSTINPLLPGAAYMRCSAENLI